MTTCAHLAPVFEGRCERCGQEVEPPAGMVDDAVADMLERLRSIDHRRMVALLDDATELIRLLHVEVCRLRRAGSV